MKNAIIIILSMLVGGGAVFTLLIYFSATPVVEVSSLYGVILTSVGVMVALLSIFLAIAAIYGYNNIKSAAIIAARKVATSEIETIQKSISTEAVEDDLLR